MHRREHLRVAFRPERIHIRQDTRRDERRSQPPKRAGNDSPLPYEIAGQERQDEETRVPGVEAVPVQVEPEEHGQFDGHGRSHRKTESDDGVRSPRARNSPESEGSNTSCFHRRSDCSRANSPERASRLPMRFTATRNASSVACTQEARDLLAQTLLELRDIEGVDHLPPTEIAPPLVDLFLER